MKRTRQITGIVPANGKALRQECWEDHECWVVSVEATGPGAGWWGGRRVHKEAGEIKGQELPDQAQ